VPPPVQVS
jgi:hypothetical protein